MYRSNINNVCSQINFVNAQLIIVNNINSEIQEDLEYF